MNNHIEIEMSQAVVIVAGVTADPPTITCVHTGSDADGIRRNFVQQVPVRDVVLARRVLSELQKGERIQVTVINEWREDGCDTYLAEFKKMPDVEQETTVKNGMPNIIQSEIKQFTHPPVRAAEAKVKH